MEKKTDRHRYTQTVRSRGHSQSQEEIRRERERLMVKENRVGKSGYSCPNSIFVY